MDEQLSLEEVRDRVDDVRVAMVTVVEADGSISTRPLTVQRICDDGTVEFLVERDAGWSSDGQATDVSLVDEGRTWVSVSGTSTYVDDRAAVEELWDDITAQFFEGPADAALMRVDAITWSYWAAPNRLAQVYQLAKAFLTDDSPDLGTSGTVLT